jgi:hypothetical protein
LGIALLLVLAVFSLKALAATPGNVGAWQAGNVVPDNLAWTSATTYNGYIYVVAGANDSIYTDNVYYAKLGTDGSIGSWNMATHAPYVSSSSQVIAHNGYMYYMGGFDGSGNTDAAYYAPINADGTLGNWSATTDIVDTRSGGSVVIHNDYMYLLGGNTGTLYTDSVTYAPLNSDGSIGTWATTTSLPDTINGGGAAVHNDRIYFVGGSNGSRLDGVYYATINPNGSLGAWQVTTSLPEEKEGLGLVEYNGYLFAIGGYSSSGVMDTVFTAPINLDGSVGTWSVSTALPAARTVLGATSANGFVYSLAGLDSSSHPSNTAYFASLTGYTPPSVHNVSASSTTGTSTTVDVLKDATDGPDAATLSIISGPAHGTARVLSGKIVYKSQDGFVGSDSLVYKVCSVSDPSVCSQATLSINVVAVAPNTGVVPADGLRSSTIMLGGILGLGLAGVIYALRKLSSEG